MHRTIKAATTDTTELHLTDEDRHRAEMLEEALCADLEDEERERANREPYMDGGFPNEEYWAMRRRMILAGY